MCSYIFFVFLFDYIPVRVYRLSFWLQGCQLSSSSRSCRLHLSSRLN